MLVDSLLPFTIKVDDLGMSVRVRRIYRRFAWRDNWRVVLMVDGELVNPAEPLRPTVPDARRRAAGADYADPTRFRNSSMSLASSRSGLSTAAMTASSSASCPPRAAQYSAGTFSTATSTSPG